MLRQRILTALVLVPLVVWGIIALPSTWLALLFGLFVAQGGWEWSRLMRLESGAVRLAYVALVLTGMVGGWYLFILGGETWLALPVLSLFWWLLALVWVLTFPRTATRWSHPFVQGVIGLLVLLPAWVAVVGLHASHDGLGPWLVMYMLSLIWVADSGAYFGGRRFGRRKLAPAVSPGKSWEGVFSALVLTGLYALLAASLFGLSGKQWPAFVVLSLVTVMFSILGDLAESMFKRQAGVKDSGTLLPGHGGVLDRIDSITSAAPVFVVGFWLGDFQL